MRPKLLVLAILIGLVVTSETGAIEFLRGDVNVDGRVTLSDAMLVSRAVFAQLHEFACDAAAVRGAILLLERSPRDSAASCASRSRRTI